MQTHERVLNFITTLRESFIGSEQVFTQGSCYKLYEILKVVFPEAKAVRDESHICVKIEDRFYDINGEHNPEEFSQEADLLENKDEDEKEYVQDWGPFSIYDVHIECPHCDELFFRAELESSQINKTRKRYGN